MDKAPETVDGKFMANMKKRFETKETDAGSLKAKPITVEGLANDINAFPEKLNIVGPIGKTSVKPSKKDENKLNGGDGKAMTGK